MRNSQIVDAKLTISSVSNHLSVYVASVDKSHMYLTPNLALTIPLYGALSQRDSTFPQTLYAGPSVVKTSASQTGTNPNSPNSSCSDKPFLPTELCTRLTEDSFNLQSPNAYGSSQQDHSRIPHQNTHHGRTI